VGFDTSEPTSRNQGKPEAIMQIRDSTYNAVRACATVAVWRDCACAAWLIRWRASRGACVRAPGLPPHARTRTISFLF
jgi:hypothetical protein